MKILLIVFCLNSSICEKIRNSNIPDDCKEFYISLTILESSWHTNKNAIKKHNYSGFFYKNHLRRFETDVHYIHFLEKWFKRKKIKSEHDLKVLILKGKYAILPEKKLKHYLKQILKIKKQIKND